MDGKAVKNAIRKNGDGKKGNRDDRPNDAKVDEQAEKVTQFTLVCSLHQAIIIWRPFQWRFFFIASENVFFLQLLKTFGISALPEDKIFILAKNHVELERENNKRVVSLKANEKALEKEQREKEHLQKEYNKGVLIR